MRAGYYIGIDPGVGGAIAVLDHAGRLISAIDFPTIKNEKGRRQIIVTELRSFLGAFVGLAGTFATVEQVWGQPSQGSTAAFNFGYACGAVVTVLDLQLIPYEYVTPQKWKKHFGLIKATKDGSRFKARKFYPEVEFKLKKDHNRAEATLIARFGWEKYRDKSISRVRLTPNR